MAALANGQVAGTTAEEKDSPRELLPQRICESTGASSKKGLMGAERTRGGKVYLGLTTDQKSSISGSEKGFTFLDYKQSQLRRVGTRHGIV